MAKRLLAFWAWCVVTGPLFSQPALPKTTAESSNYKATTRHADVVAFGESLAKQSPLIHLDTIGTSGEGRNLPLWIIADPPIKSAADAKRSEKTIVLLVGNIHAGEVDGKEALMMFARQLTTGTDRELLKDLVVVMVPILNADGNEKLAKGHRPEQAGPDEVGDRENASGLDLNRDFVKLESSEIRGLVKCLRQWDPVIMVDMHTTNGSHHRHVITHDSPRNPNCHPDFLAFGSAFLNSAGEKLKAATGINSIPYGYMSSDRKRWESYPAQPRYGVQYVGMRGRLGLLSESYAYASFPDRVRGSLEFGRAICQQAVADKEKLKSLPTELSPRIVLRTKQVPLPNPITVQGFEEVERNGKREITESKKDYQVSFVAKPEAVLEVTRPVAYLVAGNRRNVAEVLLRHGIQVAELREDIELDVECYRVNKIERSPRAFQGHRLNRLECEPRTEAQMIKAGTYVVRADQPLGNLAGMLLEPQSEDGLATWNFFDDSVKEGGDFPVVRLLKDVPLHTGAVRPLPEDRKTNQPIDLRMTMGSPRGSVDFNGSPVTGMTWLEDGEHYLQNKRGTWYKVHARTGRLQEFIDPAKIEKSVKAIEGLDEEVIKALTRRQSYSLNAARTATTLTHKGTSYLAFLDGSPGKKMPKSSGPQELATTSPDGNFVAFVRGGNLWLMDNTTGAEKQLTTDGGGQILNGKADWVYEEEIFDRRARPIWWSPDSKHIAFLRFDDTPVKQFAVVNHIPTRLNVEQIPYPKAGDPNPQVKLGVASINGGEPRFLDIPDTQPDDMLISGVEWWPDNKSVYCYVQNRVQSWLDVIVAPLTGETPRKLFRETTGAWVDNAGPLHFLPDGSFLFLSDRSGFRHLYRYRPDGTLIGPATQGEWEVKRFIGTDPEGKWVYFNGTKDNPRGSNTYRVNLDDGKLQRLTNGPGQHAGIVSLKSGLTVDAFSTPTEPTQVVLRGPEGWVIRVLDSNPVYQREDYRFGKVEAVTVPTSDGHQLHGTMIYPPDFDPAKKYPVWIKTYAGPHAPQVNDSWAGGRVSDQALASTGIIIFYVDPRSASGLGAKYTWTAYKQLGVQELKDLETAVDWLAAKPYVDAKRVGLSGHSYGGFMTAYALTHSKKFAAGISGAPVTDWRLYDSIYTERYMLTPKENPKGYDATSCVKAARNLHGKLLLLHGLMDDNVHVQNSVQFIHQLQLADKDFEVMVYPTARHGIGGRHYQRQIVNFICKSMGVPMPAWPRDKESE